MLKLPDKKRVFITGGSGFIGYHLTSKLVKSGFEVVVFDKETPTRKFSKVTFVKGNVLNFEKLQKDIQGSDIVVHLVGLADQSQAQENPQKSFKLNVHALQNVLEACKCNLIEKVVFPSSAAVYGITEDLPIKENHPINPTNVYSWHKRICEEMLVAYKKNYGIKYVILRLFNVYGRGNKGVIDFFLRKASKGEQIKVFGAHQFRDFVWAGDVAKAMFEASVLEKTDNKIINIGSGHGYQIKEILEIIKEIYPKTTWSYQKANFQVYDSIADITLAKLLLNFKPRASKLSLALQKTSLKK